MQMMQISRNRYFNILISKKKEEVLEETFQMYPNIIGRLIDAVNDL